MSLLFFAGGVKTALGVLAAEFSRQVAASRASGSSNASMPTTAPIIIPTTSMSPSSAVQSTSLAGSLAGVGSSKLRAQAGRSSSNGADHALIAGLSVGLGSLLVGCLFVLWLRHRRGAGLAWPLWLWSAAPSDTSQQSLPRPSPQVSRW